MKGLATAYEAYNGLTARTDTVSFLAIQGSSWRSSAAQVQQSGLGIVRDTLVFLQFVQPSLLIKGKAYHIRAPARLWVEPAEAETTSLVHTSMVSS